MAPLTWLPSPSVTGKLNDAVSHVMSCDVHRRGFNEQKHYLSFTGKKRRSRVSPARPPQAQVTPTKVALSCKCPGWWRPSAGSASVSSRHSRPRARLHSGPAGNVWHGCSCTDYSAEYSVQLSFSFLPRARGHIRTGLVCDFAPEFCPSGVRPAYLTAGRAGQG